MNKKILAIIPARGGSKGIPKKNIRLLAGKPLIAYTIEAALKSKYLDRIIVSTDDKEIMGISKKYKAEIIKRPKKLAQDTTPTQPVLEHVLDFLRKHENYKPDIIVLLQPTSPLRTAYHIDGAINKFLKEKYDSLLSACPSDKFIWKIERDTAISVNHGRKKRIRRQDRKPEYRENGATYISKYDTLIKKHNIMNGKIGLYIMPEENSIEIDTKFDLWLCEQIKDMVNQIKKPKPDKKQIIEIKIGKRKVGPNHHPLVIAEIGINHDGDFKKAKKMIKDAHLSGAECVKFQCHVIEDEMIPVAKKVIPGNASKSIWEIMEKCAFSEREERKLKAYAENLGMIYLSTPFSRAAADRLERMNVLAYKIGSGECNNYPLIEHIASFKKPVILSTGMNNIESIRPSVEIFKKHNIPYALLHCVSMYPVPYEKIHLGALTDLQKTFPDAVIGLSDHSIGNYTCFGAVVLGASILEKHFTSNKSWPGPDVPISIDPNELKQLIVGSKAIHQALGGKKTILKEEQPTIDFAYACVVTVKPIKKNEEFSKKNIWVKRPGTGEIKAVDYKKVLGKRAKININKNVQLKWENIKTK